MYGYDGEAGEGDICSIFLTLAGSHSWQSIEVTFRKTTERWGFYMF